MITKICPQCNKVFITEYKSQKLCSRQCAFLSMSRKVQLTCSICGKTVYVHKGTKFCSKECADSARRGVRLRPPLVKVCPVCKKSFESKSKVQKFCSKKCSNIGRDKPRKHDYTNEERLELSSRLKKQWQDEKFRQIVVDRMRTNNPSFNPEIIEKANVTRAKNGKMHNNFKYGNGKIGPYEKLVKDKIEDLGFIYNYAIVTKDARDADPSANYAHCYKPDFVKLEDKLCIEIDGYGHSTSEEKRIDAKKERCLNLLGYTVIRFTHKEIDEGVFDKWLNSYQENI